MRVFLSLLISLASTTAGAFSFPEMPFCPLGGPPGWFNRIANHDRYDRYPPPMYSPDPYQQQGWRYPPPASRGCGSNGGSCPWR